MYLFSAFIVLSVFAVIEGCQPPPCNWSDPRRIESYFEQVAAKMAAADRKLQGHCSKQGSSNVKEVHGPSDYKLVYVSAGGDVFEVKVRDRVVLVKAQNCKSSVVDVRILPSYVNTHSGVYTSEAGDLVLTFQYKYDPALGGGSCVPPNSQIITLPQGDNGSSNKIY